MRFIPVGLHIMAKFRLVHMAFLTGFTTAMGDVGKKITAVCRGAL